MLYHISPFKIDNWKPRIPSTRLKNEDGNSKYTLEKNSENISLHSFFWKELKNISNKLNKKYNKKMNIISFPYNCSEDEDLLNILSEFSKKIREKLKIGLV